MSSPTTSLPTSARRRGTRRRRVPMQSAGRLLQCVASRLVTSPVLRPIVRRPPNRRACSILQQRSITTCRPASRAISAASSLITRVAARAPWRRSRRPRRRSASLAGRSEDVDDLDRSRMPGGRVLQVGIDRTAEDLLAGPHRVDRNDVVAVGIQVDGGERAGVVVVRAQADHGDRPVGGEDAVALCLRQPEAVALADSGHRRFTSGRARRTPWRGSSDPGRCALPERRLRPARRRVPAPGPTGCRRCSRCRSRAGRAPGRCRPPAARPRSAAGGWSRRGG